MAGGVVMGWRCYRDLLRAFVVYVLRLRVARWDRVSRVEVSLLLEVHGLPMGADPLQGRVAMRRCVAPLASCMRRSIDMDQSPVCTPSSGLTLTRSAAVNVGRGGT